MVDDEGVEAKVDSREQNEDSLADDKEAGERVETMESMLEGFRDELFQLRLLYNSGRMANSWSALKQRSPSSQGPSSSTSSSSSAGYFEKRRKKEQYHQALEESGQDPLRMETLRTALPAAEYREKARERKAKKAVAPASLIGPEAAYRAYKRRLERDMPAFDAAAYRRQMEGEEHEVTEESLERVAADMRRLDSYRQKNAMRREKQANRLDDELFGSTASNRTLNRMAKKAYASVLAPISSDINRGTAL